MEILTNYIDLLKAQNQFQCTYYYERENLASFRNVKLMNGIMIKLEGKAEEAVLIH